jgi:hypothetical protein
MAGSIDEGGVRMLKKGWLVAATTAVAGLIATGAWMVSHRAPAKHDVAPMALVPPSAPQASEAPAPPQAAPEPEPQPQPPAVDEAPAPPVPAVAPAPPTPPPQPIPPAPPPRRAAPPAQAANAQGVHPSVPVARVALSFVGADAGAEAIWAGTINDPTVPAEARKDLIEDLNEDGFPDPHQVTAADLPLIMSRMDLIEQMAPDAMDDVNAAAFAEAYKDLTNMMVKALR